MLLAFGAPEKDRRDVPSLPIVGDDGDRLLVEPDDSSGDGPTVVGIKGDGFPKVEPGHGGGASCLGDELDPLDDEAIQVEQLLLTESLDELFDSACLLRIHSRIVATLRRWVTSPPLSVCPIPDRMVAMKTAYSLLLQEHVDPRAIGYEECRRFQIVCPVCMEPVFRVSRESSGNDVTFFSHYRRDETLNEQCELRVNRISGDTIAAVNAESRNQKLRLFLEVFQEIVWAHGHTDESRERAKQRFFRVRRSSVFASLVGRIADQLRDIVDDENEVLEHFDDALVYLTGSPGPFETYLHKEFAYDFLRHLLAGHAKANFLFLAQHALVIVVERIESEASRHSIDPWEHAMLDCLLRFLRTDNERKRRAILEEMARQRMVSPYTGQDTDLFVMFGAYLQSTAFGILMRLPYVRLLRDQR